MRYIFVLCIMEVITIVLSSSDPCDDSVYNDKYDWEMYKITFDKFYSNDKVDGEHIENFLQSVRSIIKQNCDYSKGLATWEAGLNEYSDKSDEEVAQLLGFNPSQTIDTNMIKELFIE